MKRLFEESHPNLFKELHPTKNIDVDFSSIYENSGRNVWWQCRLNPKHIWQQAITNRTKQGYGCPYCSGRKTLPEDSFGALHPQLAFELHPTKNPDFDPYKYRPKSSKKVWWRCKNGHEWQQEIESRVISDLDCRFCKREQKSFKNKYPELAKEWHPTKNKDLKPTDVSYGSGKKVWWQCLADKSHIWFASVASRTQFNKVECPECSKGKNAESNSLLSIYPEIAKQWHPTKNGSLKPNQVPKASRKKVWWKCPDNPDHEWPAQVKNRTILGSGCPICSKEKNIIRLSESLYDLDHSEIDHYHICLSNIRTLSKIIESDINDNSKLRQPFYRMVFSSVITALEAYLSDAFYKKIINDDELLEKYILSNPEFNKKQYPLTEVIDWQKNIRKKVTEYLFNIIWHNIPKVQNMYKEVLGVNFPSDISHLLKAIAVRHDIVHRNGRTKDGITHKLEKTQVLELLSTTKDLITYINDQITGKKTEPSH